MSPYSAVIYRPGPAWQPGVAFRDQPGIAEHAAFLRDQFVAGVLRFGGPFADDEGGLVLLTIPDVATAVELVKTDPTISRGLLGFEVHPLLLLFDAGAKAES